MADLAATAGSRTTAAAPATAPPPDVAPAPAATAAAPRRLRSLDVFRGATVAAMLLVNNPGSWGHIYAPLAHAAWNGWTPTDLIFPFFVFIVGVAAVLSFASRRARGARRSDLVRKVVSRAAVIFAVGLVMNGFPTYDVGSIRIMGVLQRIALAYLVGGLIVLYTRERGRVVAAAILLYGYWALQTLVPVPGTHGRAGVLEPGLDLGAWIDRTVLGARHLWIYSATWDPEGLLSTMGAAATLLLGSLAGEWLRSDRSTHEKTVGLLLAGNLALALGLAWNAALPINKNLWTGSYAVFTAGFAAVTLAFSYWIVDVRGHGGAWTAPFVAFGTNAIAAFFLSGVFTRGLNLIRVGEGARATSLYAWLYAHLFLPWLGPFDASLAFALTYVALFTALVMAMQRRGIAIKV